ncbi:hypothetical protein ACFQZE_05525 [Paenibacillus sp. GCM10027627]|uniref:hypothetical protein n=1 Tax=unclassified Paenibacillus TaxID=185978 RepID=UPI0036457AE9
MEKRVLIAGGYGIVGSAIAKHIRKLDEEIEVIIGGRNPERGLGLAEEIGHASTAYLDLTDIESVKAVGRVDLIVAALQDPADTLIGYAIENGIAHIGITKLADELAPLAAAALAHPAARPIVPLGHSQSGVLTVAALKLAQSFKRVDYIGLAGLYDEKEQMGPMTLGDSEGFIGRALLREDGNWAWVQADARPRGVEVADGTFLEGLPMGLLDVPGLAAATGAPNVRFDFIVGDSIGTKAGKLPSQDLYIEMEGELVEGQFARRRLVVTDPFGQAHMTALGVLLSIEAVLGLDGKTPAAGGLQLPESMLSIEAALSRLDQFGVEIIELS